MKPIRLLIRILGTLRNLIGLAASSIEGLFSRLKSLFLSSFLYIANPVSHAAQIRIIGAFNNLNSGMLKNRDRPGHVSYAVNGAVTSGMEFILSEANVYSCNDKVWARDDHAANKKDPQNKPNRKNILNNNLFQKLETPKINFMKRFSQNSFSAKNFMQENFLKIPENVFDKIFARKFSAQNSSRKSLRDNFDAIFSG